MMADGLPADPFSTGDEARDALAEARLFWDALTEVVFEGGRLGLARAIETLTPDQARSMILIAVIDAAERATQSRRRDKADEAPTGEAARRWAALGSALVTDGVSGLIEAVRELPEE